MKESKEVSEKISKNNCPICDKKMKEDDNMYYCENDGTNIDKRPKKVIPFSAREFYF